MKDRRETSEEDEAEEAAYREMEREMRRRETDGGMLVLTLVFGMVAAGVLVVVWFLAGVLGGN